MPRSDVEEISGFQHRQRALVHRCGSASGDLIAYVVSGLLALALVSQGVIQNFSAYQTQLIREVWGPERVDDSRSLRVCIENLRGKLERDPKRPRHLVTEAGLGYRLRAEND